MRSRTKDRGQTLAAEQLKPAIAGEGAMALDYLAGILQAPIDYAIIGLDATGTIQLWSEGAHRLYGYTAEEMVGTGTVAVLNAIIDEASDRASVASRETTQSVSQLTSPCISAGLHHQRRKNEELFPAQIFVWQHRDVAVGAGGWLMMVRDVSAEHRLLVDTDALQSRLAQVEAARRENEERYRLITETLVDAVLLTDEGGKIRYANSAAAQIFGYAAVDMVDLSAEQLMPEFLHHMRQVPAAPANESGRQHSSRVGLRGVRKDGQQIPLEAWFGCYHSDKQILCAGIIRDTSERRLAEQRVRHIAQHDALTGLPNRALIHDRISQAIEHARRNHDSVAVLFLDLDGFKPVNDSLGHRVGDELLRMVAKRLLACVRAEDSVGRLGGDEFVIGLPQHVDDRGPMLIASKILESLHEPFVVNEHVLHIGASIGIGLFPNDGDNADALLHAADSAMYYAKKQGRNNYQFFTKSLNDAARRRLTIANGLHQAVDRKEFMLEYQPQVDLRDKRIFAAEVLLRWRHPELGWIPPSEFIKVAEETGLISPIGEWVLTEACKQLVDWRRQGNPDLRIAVNLSPEQFRRPGFVEMLRRTLHEVGLPAVALELEITEGVFMTQSTENIAKLSQIAGMGVQLAMDDFGTGYSSFAYLKRFPIDTIKIDQSFVSGVVDDPSDTSIVTAIIAMAENLRLGVVAEGVENNEQADFLLEHGCLSAQGYFYHPPVDAPQFRQLLELA